MRFRLLRSFRGLSFCHIHALCSNGIEHVNTICFAYDSIMSLPHRYEVWRTSVNLSPPTILPHTGTLWPTPVDLSVESLVLPSGEYDKTYGKAVCWQQASAL